MKISHISAQLSLVLLLVCVITGSTTAQTGIDPKVGEVLKAAQKHKKASPELDEKIKAGFALLGEKKWAEARLKFEGALAAYNKELFPSEFLFTKISLPDEDPDQKLDETAAAMVGFRHSLGTEQSLIEFLAFTAQLEGNSALADKYTEQLYKLQGPLWGTSWRMFLSAAYEVFAATVKPEKNENYGRYLFMAGDLMANVDAERAFQLIRESQETLPKDPAVAGMLANYYVMHKDPASAKKQAQLSLAADPKQNRVLIDLATAQWMLGEIDDAAKSAAAAKAIDPKLPGPYANLALVALEKGDATTALKEAASGVELSNRHPYYLLIQAAAFELSGDGKQAEKLIKEVYEEKFPTKEALERWFFRGKPLALVLTVISRLKGTDSAG